ncbi:Hypothetical predicted protein [Cloeon dipterum]|uniref:Uncharacterized protein n=1 Tax=Cloeon dipterum TaxID=197152 RepID=A0A8S1DJG1_9INSE|nr:Hypothetical predicted protein [Cloeon dipterum]
MEVGNEPPIAVEYVTKIKLKFDPNNLQCTEEEIAADARTYQIKWLHFFTSMAVTLTWFVFGYGVTSFFKSTESRYGAILGCTLYLIFWPSLGFFIGFDIIDWLIQVEQYYAWPMVLAYIYTYFFP